MEWTGTFSFFVSSLENLGRDPPIGSKICKGYLNCGIGNPWAAHERDRDVDTGKAKFSVADDESFGVDPAKGSISKKIMLLRNPLPCSWFGKPLSWTCKTMWKFRLYSKWSKMSRSWWKFWHWWSNRFW